MKKTARFSSFSLSSLAFLAVTAATYLPASYAMEKEEVPLLSNASLKEPQDLDKILKSLKTLKVISDAADTVFIGETRAGKSSWCDFLNRQFLRVNVGPSKRVTLEGSSGKNGC